MSDPKPRELLNGPLQKSYTGVGAGARAGAGVTSAAATTTSKKLRNETAVLILRDGCEEEEGKARGQYPTTTMFFSRSCLSPPLSYPL